MEFSFILPGYEKCQAHQVCQEGRTGMDVTSSVCMCVEYFKLKKRG